MVRLKAPPGTAEINVAGFDVKVIAGFADVPQQYVDTLRSHGFVLAEGEDAMLRGSRWAMIARFINDARSFADTMTDAQLAAYTDMATMKPSEATQGAWKEFVDGVGEMHHGVTTHADKRGFNGDDGLDGEDADIDVMKRPELFAHLKALGISPPNSTTNEDLRAMLREA
jgi:hypothetical protein